MFFFLFFVTAGGKKPRSNCVDAVKKIQERREARRAQQNALRAERDQEYDTSTPNWEFDAMIRFFFTKENGLSSFAHNIDWFVLILANCYNIYDVNLIEKH